MMTIFVPPRRASVAINSWAGWRTEMCMVVAETSKRYRITVGRRTRIAGRNRYLNPGETALVPKAAIRFLDGAA